MSLRFRSTVAFLFVLASAAPSVASAQIEEGRIPLQTALTELFRFRESYGETYNRKDTAALTAMFDVDAIMINDAGVVFKGRAAIGKLIADGAATQPHMVIQSDSLRVYGNTAVDVGTLRLHPAGSPEVVTRYMVVLRRGFNEWKLVYVANTPVK